MTERAKPTSKPTSRAHPALSRVRGAVREFFKPAPRRALLQSGELCVAVSGGADSLALAEACAYFGHNRGIRVQALIVDHGLQEGSSDVARQAATDALSLGVTQVQVIRVKVDGSGGPEAAARKARYTALSEAAPQDALVMLGHTRDDQAETVLLGLGRGSGPRSIAGMRSLDSQWARPLLEVSRADTREACAALGIRPWDDPHNVDPKFTRVRLRREVLPLLEEVLSGGVAEALARTAVQLREDCEALDTLAGELALGLLGSSPVSEAGELAVSAIASVPVSLRRRVFRIWLLNSGVPELTDAQLRSVDALITQWRGQGGVWLPGGFVVSRSHGRLDLARPPTKIFPSPTVAKPPDSSVGGE